MKITLVSNVIIGDVGPQGLTGLPGYTVKGEKGLPGISIRCILKKNYHNILKKINQLNIMIFFVLNFFKLFFSHTYIYIYINIYIQFFFRFIGKTWKRWYIWYIWRKG